MVSDLMSEVLGVLRIDLGLLGVLVVLGVLMVLRIILGFARGPENLRK